MPRYLTSVQRVPGYLPYRRALGRNPGPVPNEAQCFWPQGQFQPNYLPAGGPSFIPRRFHDGTARLIFDNEVEPGIEEEYAGILGEAESLGKSLLLVALGFYIGHYHGQSIVSFVRAKTAKTR